MAKNIKKSVINKRIKKLENEIKRLQSIIKEHRGDEKNKARSSKVKIYKKIIKAHQKAKEAGYTKQIKSRISGYNKKLKEIKIYKPRVKKDIIDIGIRKPTPDDLYNKYENLLQETDKLNKGIKRALEMAGISKINDIEDTLGIEGLTWEEVKDMLELFYNDDIEEIFYENPDDPDRVFDGEYFKNSLRDMIADIRENKEKYGDYYRMM